MAKRRLNAWMRDKLYSHLKEIIEPKGFKEKIDAAYERAAPHVYATVQKKFPPADSMVWCSRNTVSGGIDDCIKLHLHDGAIAMFYFKADTGPYAAKMTYQHQIYEADVESHIWCSVNGKKPLQDYEEEKKKRYNAYRHLVLSSKYPGGRCRGVARGGNAYPLVVSCIGSARTQ